MARSTFNEFWAPHDEHRLRFREPSSSPRCLPSTAIVAFNVHHFAVVDIISAVCSADGANSADTASYAHWALANIVLFSPSSSTTGSADESAYFLPYTFPRSAFRTLYALICLPKFVLELLLCAGWLLWFRARQLDPGLLRRQ